jgi:hypothetical protein
VVLSGLEAAGLPAASLIRMKVLTLDNQLIHKQVGELGAEDCEAAKHALAKLLGW